MSDSQEEIPEDFEVYPSSRIAASDFMTALSTLQRALKPADVKPYARPGEVYNDVIIRLALNAINNQSVLYRKNDSAEETKILAWLSLVSEKSKFEVLTRVVPKFNGLNIEQLREIALISLNPDRITSLVDELANSYGIVLVVEPGFKSMKMDGCTFKLPQGTPVVGIALRYNRYDNFWFTLMHELAHVHKHYAYLDNPILDDLEIEQDSDRETEANIIAKDSLVSRQYWRMAWNVRADKRQLLDVCIKAKVHPSIMAGMIRYQARNFKLYPELHHTMDVKSAFGFVND